MNLVYLAGPIYGATDSEAHKWRRHATQALQGKVLDPMSRDYRGKEQENPDDIVLADLADIAGCTAVLANCWTPSYGTAQELVYAHLLGKRVVAIVPNPNKVSPWLRFHSDVLVPNVGAGVGAVLRQSLDPKGPSGNARRLLGLHQNAGAGQPPP